MADLTGTVEGSLKQAMATLALTSSDVAEMMGVTHKVVDKWLRTGISSTHLDRVSVLVQITDILRHRLSEGKPAVVIRCRAETYEGRSMVVMIADGEHYELLESIQTSFDYVNVA